jgi:hypothetical protein
LSSSPDIEQVRLSKRPDRPQGVTPGPLDLNEALELTALIALRDRARSERYALRWLARRLEETPATTLDEAVMTVGALAALGGNSHEVALAFLRSPRRA